MQPIGAASNEHPFSLVHSGCIRLQRRQSRGAKIVRLDGNLVGQSPTDVDRADRGGLIVGESLSGYERSNDGSRQASAMDADQVKPLLRACTKTSKLVQILLLFNSLVTSRQIGSNDSVETVGSRETIGPK